MNTRKIINPEKSPTEIKKIITDKLNKEKLTATVDVLYPYDYGSEIGSYYAIIKIENDIGAVVGLYDPEELIDNTINYIKSYQKK